MPVHVVATNKGGTVVAKGLWTWTPNPSLAPVAVGKSLFVLRKCLYVSAGMKRKQVNADNKEGTDSDTAK
jgi:hypothetical protein